MLNNTAQYNSILAFFFSDIKLYVMYEIHWDEVDAILSFLAAATDAHIQEEVLRLLHNLLKAANCQYILGELLWEKGIPLLVLIRAQSMSVRLLAIKVGHEYVCRKEGRKERKKE